MWVLQSNSSSAANQCLAKVAFFHGEEERCVAGAGPPTSRVMLVCSPCLLPARFDSFGKAAEVFDQVGNDYLRNNLLKFNARTHFTNALLCHLANDVRACLRAFICPASRRVRLTGVPATACDTPTGHGDGPAQAERVQGERLPVCRQ